MVTIPATANKVFQGDIFSVRQYPQEMFDGELKTFELAARPSTVIVFPTVGEQILLAYEKQPHFENFELGFLGGRQDDGETPMECAQRELLEETGMISDDWFLWKYYETGSKLAHKTYFYIARNAQKVSGQHLDKGGEIITIQPVSYHDFIDGIVDGRLGKGDFRADILYMKLTNSLDLFTDALFHS